MGRLCGGAHEISGIKAPLFPCGWWGGGGVGGGRMSGVLVRDVGGGGRLVGWVVVVGRVGGRVDDGVLGGCAGEEWGG